MSSKKFRELISLTKNPVKCQIYNIHIKNQINKRIHLKFQNNLLIKLKATEKENYLNSNKINENSVSKELLDSNSTLVAALLESTQFQLTNCSLVIILIFILLPFLQAYKLTKKKYPAFALQAPPNGLRKTKLEPFCYQYFLPNYFFKENNFKKILEKQQKTTSKVNLTDVLVDYAQYRKILINFLRFSSESSIMVFFISTTMPKICTWVLVLINSSNITKNFSLQLILFKFPGRNFIIFVHKLLILKIFYFFGGKIIIWYDNNVAVRIFRFVSGSNKPEKAVFVFVIFVCVRQTLKCL